MAAVSSPDIALSSVVRKKLEQSPISDDYEIISISPSTTVSDLSVDSGVGTGSDEYLGLGLEWGEEGDHGENYDFESSHIYENFEFSCDSPKHDHKQEKSFTGMLTIDCNEPITPQPEQFLNTNKLLVTTVQEADTITRPKSEAEIKRPRDCKKGRQRHHTDGDCLDNTEHDAGAFLPTLIDCKDDLEGKDLSLILTTQNPSRIDVKTLRKKKVSLVSYLTITA